MEFTSLFAGIGGFELGFEKAGMKCVCQVENNKYCIQVLGKYWPDVQRLGDIRDVRTVPGEVICGGDPCPSRSRAKRGNAAVHPDLSGYFLAVAARSRPRWVVRENVLAPDVIHFAAGLEALGYGVIIIELDARDFTAQSRRRQFVIGCPVDGTADLRRVLCARSQSDRPVQESGTEQSEACMCITTHHNRMAAEDNYGFEQGRGLRVLTPEERESLQGFPRGWTADFSRSRRYQMLGNAVPPPMTEWIGRVIMQIENDD